MAKVQTNLGASVRMPPYTVTYVTWRIIWLTQQPNKVRRGSLGVLQMEEVSAAGQDTSVLRFAGSVAEMWLLS